MTKPTRKEAYMERRRAMKYLLHTLRRLQERIADGSAHPYDLHKVEGAVAAYKKTLS